MKKYIFLFIVFFIKINIDAQNVNIPDPNFKSFLLSSLQFNPNQDTEISIAEANSAVGVMNCSGLNISDLTGVEEFINISELQCDNNNLSSLNISNNVNLTSLTCSNNQLTSISLLNNINLETLSLSYNQLTNLDLSLNTQIVSLFIDGILSNSIDLSNNNNLTILAVRNSNLNKLNLSNNSLLKNLFATNTSIDSLDVSTNANLEILVVDSNQNLTYLNVKNGNNTAIFYYDSRVTPNLTCIEVDNVAWSNSNWTWRDANNVFNTNCTVGLEEFVEKTNLSIYPNPTNNLVTVQLAALPSNGMVNIKDVLGKTLLQQKITSINTEINVNHLPKGIYYVELVDDSYKHAKKLVVN